jgi:hypothetical protein
MRNRKGNVLVSGPRTGCLLAVWNSREAFEAAYPPGSTAKDLARPLREGFAPPCATMIEFSTLMALKVVWKTPVPSGLNIARKKRARLGAKQAPFQGPSCPGQLRNVPCERI